MVKYKYEVSANGSALGFYYTEKALQTAVIELVKMGYTVTIRPLINA